MIPYPSFEKIAFEIGPFDVWYFGVVSLKVHWYGIMYLVAFAAAWWLGRVRARKPGSTWKSTDIDDFMFFGMLGTILGGRLGYVFFYGLGVLFIIWNFANLYYIEEKLPTLPSNGKEIN